MGILTPVLESTKLTAAKCNFGQITESLVKDVFIVNMANKEVQQKLCTDPKQTVNGTIQFAIAYGEGTIRQQSFDKLERPNINTEATEVNNINRLDKERPRQQMLPL